MGKCGRKCVVEVCWGVGEVRKGVGGSVGSVGGGEER